MSVQQVKWGSKIKFSRGPQDDKDKVEYSTGGSDGEEVTVPQIDENLNGNDFFQALVNLVGTEEETKKIVNKQVLAYPAIKEGQQKFKASWKKTGVMDKVEATKQALLAIKDYVPVLTKERGAVVTEAFQKASQMDALKAARLKVARGEMDFSEFEKMLEEAFAVEGEGEES